MRLDSALRGQLALVHCVVRHLDQRIGHPLRVLAAVPGAARGERFQRGLHGSSADRVEDRVNHMHAVGKRADVQTPTAEVELFIALAAVRIDRIAHTPAKVAHLGHAHLFRMGHKRLFVQAFAALCSLFVQVADRGGRLEPEPARRQRLCGVGKSLELLAHANAIGGRRPRHLAVLPKPRNDARAAVGEVPTLDLKRPRR